MSSGNQSPIKFLTQDIKQFCAVTMTNFVDDLAYIAWPDGNSSECEVGLAQFFIHKK